MTTQTESRISCARCCLLGSLMVALAVWIASDIANNP
jgi:hypothetical protein